MRKLGSTIRILRMVQEISVDELSATSGISPQHIHHIEAETRNPSLDTLDRLAKGLHTNSALLLLIADLEDPLTQPLLPMIYMSVYNTIAPQVNQWRYP